MPIFPVKGSNIRKGCDISLGKVAAGFSLRQHRLKTCGTNVGDIFVIFRGYLSRAEGKHCVPKQELGYEL